MAASTTPTPAGKAAACGRTPATAPRSTSRAARRTRPRWCTSRWGRIRWRGRQTANRGQPSRGDIAARWQAGNFPGLPIFLELGSVAAERGLQLPAETFLHLPLLPLAVEERPLIERTQAVREQVEAPGDRREDHPWIVRRDEHVHHGKHCDDDAILGEMHVEALDPARMRERKGLLGADLRCRGRLHISLPQGGKIDLEDRSDRLQRFRAGVLPALD